jgi:Niemann-Pick C1 protein
MTMTSCASSMQRFAQMWPRRVGAACGAVVRRVAQWPFVAVLSCTLLLLLCCVSWLRVHIETDQAAVWNDPDSPYAQNERKYAAVFGPMYMLTSVVLAARNETTDVLTVNGFREVNAVLNALYDVNVFSERMARNVSLRDVCLTPIPNGPCMVQSPMDFFLNNFTLVQERAASIKRDVSIASLHPIGFTLSRTGLLGGLEYRDGSTIVHKATGFKIEIILNTSFAGFTGPQRLNPLLVEWNARAIATVENLRTNGTLAICDAAVNTDEMPEREIMAELANQIPTLAVGIGVILLFTVINLGQCSPRCETRIAIALCTAVSVGLTVAAALGLPALGNVPVTSVTAQVVPMLVYSIGVDNVFIVVKTFYAKRDALRRVGGTRATIDVDAIASTYTEVGPPILSTACSMFAVFFICGLLSTSPAVAYIGYQVAIAIVANVVTQFVALPGICVIDARVRYCREPKIVIPTEEMSEPAGETDGAEPPTQKERRRWINCVGGIGVWYSSLLLSVSATRWRRLAVVSVMLAIAGACIGMATMLTTNFDLTVYFSEDGNMHRFLASRARLFPNSSTIPYFIVTGNVDYTLPSTQAAMEDIVTDLKSPKKGPTYVAADAMVSWHRNLRSWLTFKAHQQQFEREKNIIPPELLVPWVREFVGGLGAAHSIDLVWKRASDGAISPPGARLEDLDASWSNSTIYTSRVWGTFRSLTTTDEFLGAIDQTENVTAAYADQLKSFSYSPFYPYLWQFVGLQATLAISILVSLLAVFLITLAFSCNLTTSLVMLALLIVVVVDMLGFLWLFGVTLNALALLIVASAIGIASEYFNYVIGSYATVNSMDPRERVLRVGSSTAVYLLLAAASSVVGMTVVLFGNVPLVRLYFGAPWFLIVLVSGLHALLVLPVLLSVPWIAERVRPRDAPVLDIVHSENDANDSDEENDADLLTHHAGKSEFLSASSD